MGDYKMNLGDIVVDEDGQIGKVTDPQGMFNESEYRVTYRFPVLFPWKNGVLWYSACECRLPTETELKHHFKECIRGKRIKT